MIPKIIHYCWFGNNEKSSFIKKCISSWSRKLKGYKIIEWNDENISELTKGVHSKFLDDALKQKKYAFISDYIRLLALQKYGGIYLDTDVFVYKTFDLFLENDVFLGYISDKAIGTAVIGANADSVIIKEWITYLDDFYLKNNKFISNNIWMTDFFVNNYSDFILNGENVCLSNGLCIYKKHYFEAEKPFYIKNGGICAHKCLNSWIEDKPKVKVNPIKEILRPFSPKFILKIRDYNRHRK